MAILHISFLLLVSGVSILAVPLHKAHLYRKAVPLHKALPLHKAHLYREAIVRRIKTHINFKGNTPCYLTIEGNCTRDMNKTTISLSGGHPVEVTGDNAAALRERLMHPGELKSPQGFRVRSGSDSSEERVPSIADYEPWEPSVPDFEGNPEVPVIPGPRSGGGGGGGRGGNAATGGGTTGGVGGGIDRGEAGEGAGESGGTETGEGVGAAGAEGAGGGGTVGGGGTGAGGAGGGAGAGGAGGVGGSGGVGGAGGRGGTGGRARPPMFPVLPPVNSNPQLPAMKPAQPQQPSKPGTGIGAGPQVPLIPQTIGPVINHSNQKEKPSSVTAALAGTFVPLGIVVGAAIAGLIGYRKWRRQHLPTSANYQTMSQRAVVNA